MRIIQKAKNIYHLFQAVAACIWYGFPSRKIKVIGVTGTDGKTTTTHLMYHILKSAGKRVSMISTVYAKIGDSEYDTGLHTTTPGAFLIQKLLRKSVSHNDEYFVLETTSHALDQNRVWGVTYEWGILTNITHEHLDYHRHYEDYAATKLLLLQRAKTSIINRDDSSYDIARHKHIHRIITYSLKEHADYTYDVRNEHPLIPEFNAYNYLAAYAAASEIGVKKSSILASIRSFKLPPGRADVVYKGDFTVIVDFAHTPNAISNILKTVRKTFLKNGGRIIHVFGSAGLRDASKRPLMGRASGAQADLVILTEEDYRTEDPEEICRQIAEGLKEEKFAYRDAPEKGGKGTYSIELNRERAIRRAIDMAREGDIIVITGKGHEKSLCRGKKEYPWDDREAVLRLIKTS